MVPLTYRVTSDTRLHRRWLSIPVPVGSVSSLFSFVSPRTYFFGRDNHVQDALAALPSKAGFAALCQAVRIEPRSTDTGFVFVNPQEVTRSKCSRPPGSGRRFGVQHATLLRSSTPFLPPQSPIPIPMRPLEVDYAAALSSTNLGRYHASGA